MKNKILGLINASILGDIYGLKYEGIKPKNINRDNILSKTFYNQYSDDTEHLLIMYNLIKNNKNFKDEKLFQKELKKWLFTFPYGIGKSTLFAIIKSFFTKKSGINSTGNGCLMRIGILSCFLNENEISNVIRNYVIITHNNEETIEISIFFARIIKLLLNENKNLIEFIKNYNFKSNQINKYKNDFLLNYQNKESLSKISKDWTKNKGAYGYVTITVFLSLYNLLINQDNFENGLKDMISLGGDTDTNSFIYGTLFGVCYGDNKINKDLKKVLKFSYKISYIKLLFKNIIFANLAILEIFFRWINLLKK